MKKSVLKKIVTLLIAFITVLAVMPLNVNAKGGITSAQKADVKAVFDSEYYYNNNPDVAAAFGNDYNALLDHYINNGLKEGRSASATFNATAYRNRYPDLDNAFGDNMISYVTHFVDLGIAEGRDASTPDGAAIAYYYKSDAQGNPIGTLIGTRSTKYNAKIGRAKNVELAASQINGRVLAPGETFSFLGSITPRTVENGYVMATVFTNKQKSQGIGGGICQVSSTIYAAVVNTGVRIDERHAHSLPVTYLPEGLDATVSSPNLDMRFTNTFDTNLYLEVTASKGVLTVNVYKQ